VHDFCVVNLATGQSSSMAPVGALYVVAAAEEAGYSVSFRDYALEHGPDLFSLDRITRFLAAADSPILGISCFANALPYALGAAERLRRQRPDIRIVLGGPGPSAVSTLILRSFPSVDYIVFGEGEETIVELLAYLHGKTSDPGTISGLAWRGMDGEVHRNPPRSRRRDLDSIPFPAYHHVDLSAYDVVGVAYSRGCPYACTYCDVVSMWDRRNIARSLENVLTEILELVTRHHISHIAFVDDLFTVDRKRILDFCSAFREAGSPTSWGCTTRIDRVDNELLDRMAEANCTYVFYGVESGSKKILSLVNKIVPAEKTVKAIQRSAKLGMYVHTPLMWGFPFENMNDFRETLGFGRYLEHCGANVFYTLATPLPATKLYEEFKNRLVFNPEIYSTIIAPGRTVDLAEVEELIRNNVDLFPGFYHFADGGIEEKIALGRKLNLNLSDIRINNLRESPVCL
jgi:anaerobic magnesium-protoporphyrin IX monomethyl ester cyclase